MADTTGPRGTGGPTVELTARWVQQAEEDALAEAANAAGLERGTYLAIWVAAAVLSGLSWSWAFAAVVGVLGAVAYSWKYTLPGRMAAFRLRGHPDGEARTVTLAQEGVRVGGTAAPVVRGWGLFRTVDVRTDQRPGILLRGEWPVFVPGRAFGSPDDAAAFAEAASRAIAAARRR